MPMRSSHGSSSSARRSRGSRWWNMAARSKVDFATLAGIALGVGGIVGGLIFEGGHVGEIVSPTALAIVLGGTIGAVLVSTPGRVLRGGLRALLQVVVEKVEDPGELINQIVDYSTKARKNGLVSLEDV